MVRVGGLDYTIDPSKKLYERITDARLDNGHLIEADQKYKVAGWAQVNYPYANSVGDTLVKLQYDLYYIKHQSLYLDLIIVLKTIGVVLTMRGT